LSRPCRASPNEIRPDTPIKNQVRRKKDAVRLAERRIGSAEADNMADGSFEEPVQMTGSG